MNPLAWLAIPLVALIGALLWAAWAGRQRGPADPMDTVAAYHRFVRALERSRPEPPTRPVGDRAGDPADAPGRRDREAG